MAKMIIMGIDKHDRAVFVNCSKEGGAWAWRVGAIVAEDDGTESVIWQYKGKAADEHKALDMAKTHAIVDPLDYIGLQ